MWGATLFASVFCTLSMNSNWIEPCWHKYQFMSIATRLISTGTCHNLFIARWHHDISRHQHKQTFSQHCSLSTEQLEFCLHACPSYVVWSLSPLLPVATLPLRHGYIREPSNPNMRWCLLECIITGRLFGPTKAFGVPVGRFRDAAFCRQLFGYWVATS